MVALPSDDPAGATTMRPVLTGRQVRLVPATRADASDAYMVLLESGVTPLPTLDQWVDDDVLGRDVSALFTVRDLTTDDMAGYSSLHDANLSAGHVTMGIYTRFGPDRRGPGAEAALLTIHYAFATWNVRKVYFHTTDASLPSFRLTADRMFVREGVLTDFVFFRGRLWDQHIYSISRDSWARTHARTAERLRRHDGTAAGRGPAEGEDDA